MPIRLLLVSFLSLFTAQFVLADSENLRTKHYNLRDGIAIKGYDPVAYFSGNATKGKKEYAVTNKGVTYYFSSEQNVKTFQANPNAYEPQYGGWCAYAFAINKGKVGINPKSYKIIDGKLYLFYHKTLGGNTLKAWNKADDHAQISIADKTWKKELTQ